MSGQVSLTASRALPVRHVLIWPAAVPSAEMTRSTSQFHFSFASSPSARAALGAGRGVVDADEVPALLRDVEGDHGDIGFGVLLRDDGVGGRLPVEHHDDVDALLDEEVGVLGRGRLAVVVAQLDELPAPLLGEAFGDVALQLLPVGVGLPADGEADGERVVVAGG